MCRSRLYCFFSEVVVGRSGEDILTIISATTRNSPPTGFCLRVLANRKFSWTFRYNTVEGRIKLENYERSMASAVDVKKQLSCLKVSHLGQNMTLSIYSRSSRSPPAVVRFGAGSVHAVVVQTPCKPHAGNMSYVRRSCRFHGSRAITRATVDHTWCRSGMHFYLSRSI